MSHLLQCCCATSAPPCPCPDFTYCLTITGAPEPPEGSDIPGGSVFWNSDNLSGSGGCDSEGVFGAASPSISLNGDTFDYVETTIHIQNIGGLDYWVFGVLWTPCLGCPGAEYLKTVLKETDCPPLPTTLTPADLISGTCPCTIVFEACP